MDNKTKQRLNFFKSFVRRTDFGGYISFAVMQDNGCLCWECCKDNARLIMQATAKGFDRGWAFYAAEINYEDDSLYCDHCNKQIPASYS